MLSLGLTRKVSVSEEYPFRHQKIQPLAAPSCYPARVQNASICALDYNNGHRNGRSLNNTNRSEEREV